MFAAVCTQTAKSRVGPTSSDILLRTLWGDGSLGEQWLEVWHQLSSYVNHGGFPRTWYAGKHCSGRASQQTTAHILATGIPEVHRHLISIGNTHASPLSTVASEWVDPGLMVSLFFGWFWYTFLLVVSGSGAKSEKSRTAVAWWYVLKCVLTLPELGFFCTMQKVTNCLWCHPESIWGSPSHPAAFCLSKIQIQQ